MSDEPTIEDRLADAEGAMNEMRIAANQAMGGNYAFIDDDAKYLGILASWALDNGFPREKFPEAVQRNIGKAALVRNAAPDMLELLEAFVLLADGPSMHWDEEHSFADSENSIILRSRAAIARAKGGAA